MTIVYTYEAIVLEAADKQVAYKEVDKPTLAPARFWSIKAAALNAAITG